VIDENGVDYTIQPAAEKRQPGRPSLPHYDFCHRVYGRCKKFWGTPAKNTGIMRTHPGIVFAPHPFLLPQTKFREVPMPRRSDADVSTITRREFTLESALALLSTVVVTVSGCDDDSTPTTPSTPPSNVSGTISANHGHTAAIQGAQISAGTAFSLNITGTATHPHTVDITQGDLMALQNRQTVTKTSTTDSGHSHMVTFTP
jgi:hypothetical protein